MEERQALRIEASDIRVILLQGLQTPSTAALDFPASHSELARHQRALLALNRLWLFLC